MQTEQRIYNAAKHAFLKYGYHGTTMEQIARYAGSGKAMVHYYFRTKDKLYELVFSEFIKTLFSELHQNKSLKSHPYEQGIEYPELYEIAWFIANEFRTNNQIALNIIKKNTGIKSILETANQTENWVDCFQNLVAAQLKDILIKNRLTQKIHRK